MPRGKNPEERERILSILQMPANTNIPERIIKIIHYTNLSYRGLLEKWLHQEESSIKEAQRAEEDILKRIDMRLDVLQQQITRLEAQKAKSGNPNAAAYRKSLVLQVLAMRKAGKTYKQIADLFNGEGTRTLSGRGKWAVAMVAQLLKPKKSD